MKTSHRYLTEYPIAADSEKLIVGTIHPHNHEAFEVDFFYGNMGSIWKILSQVFPEELANPKDLNGILAFLASRKIAVSDTVLECDRQNLTARDEDLTNIELNKGIIEDIKKSNISEILFTSGFGKNNAFKLFYEGILGEKITKEIKINRGLTLQHERIGRPVKLTVLYSPSGAANRGISKSSLYLNNKEKYENSLKPVHAFKVDYYRDKFNGE